MACDLPQARLRRPGRRFPSLPAEARGKRVGQHQIAFHRSPYSACLCRAGPVPAGSRVHPLRPRTRPRRWVRWVPGRP
eukprot:9588726-Alexandrium_andersonii.AAC.1